MKVTPFRAGEPKTFTTLDFAGQGFYTSGHCIDKHDLDDTTGHDLSKLDPAAFENGEHRGYLTTASEFPIRHANLMRKSASTGVDHLQKTLLWDDDDLEPFLALNANPDAMLDTTEIYIQIVPVEHAWEVVAAFPNGYFAGDLEPMDNVVLARHLEQAYGYELFGIGSAYVGYLKRRPLDDITARRLAAEVLALHDGADDPALPAKVAASLQAQDWLILHYTGGG